MIKLLLGTNNGEGKRDNFIIQYNEWVLEVDKKLNGEFEINPDFPAKSLEEFLVFNEIDLDSPYLEPLSSEPTEVSQQALYYFIMQVKKYPLDEESLEERYYKLKKFFKI